MNNETTQRNITLIFAFSKTTLWRCEHYISKSGYEEKNAIMSSSSQYSFYFTLYCVESYCLGFEKLRISLSKGYFGHRDL
jgi:hypothetical protein